MVREHHAVRYLSDVFLRPALDESKDIQAVHQPRLDVQRWLHPPRLAARIGSRFCWNNYSAPSSKPVVDPSTIVGKRKLRSELADQIRPVGCVIILAGMYASYREWIQA